VCHFDTRYYFDNSVDLRPADLQYQTLQAVRNVARNVRICSEGGGDAVAIPPDSCSFLLASAAAGQGGRSGAGPNALPNPAWASGVAKFGAVIPVASDNTGAVLLVVLCGGRGDNARACANQRGRGSRAVLVTACSLSIASCM
jgi:hypothetical protein